MSAENLTGQGVDEPDVATQKLNELRERASKDFSDKEINDFINSAKILASKAVLTALINVIQEGPQKGLSEQESKKLTQKITKLMPYSYSGYVSLGFKEIPDTLNLSLTIAEKDYHVDISVPGEGYERDLFSQIAFLRKIATTYWEHFSRDNQKLIERVANYRRDVDFSKLTIDEKRPMTMYFDPDSKKRISIFGYYVDVNGKPFQLRLRK